MLKELIKKNRSYRRFYENEEISIEFLEKMVDNARIANSAVNKQPLKYVISNDREVNEKIFTTLHWAGLLKDWDGPVEGERPAAYIVILGDTSISRNYLCDPGIACSCLLLTAVENDLGGCIINSINRNKLKDILNIDKEYEILYIIALGKPKETVILEELNSDGDTKYYRDNKMHHHVPKRSLEEIIVNRYIEK